VSWVKDVTDYILNHLEDYAKTFLSSNIEASGRSIFVNPCPYCDHKNCFSLTKGFNGGHCFSCDASGSLIKIIEDKYGEIDGRQMLSEWSGKKYNFASHEPAQSVAKEQFARFQRICQKAIDFYHKRLRSVTYQEHSTGEQIAPAYYQTKNRKHRVETLMKYKVGYSGGWVDLKKQLLEDGYEEFEIKRAQALVGLPEGYFVYPYYDEKGNLVRVNCKIFIRTCRGKARAEGGYHYDCKEIYFRLDDFMKTAHENSKGHSMIPNNISRGDKEGVFFGYPKDLRSKKKKHLILVEGENDLLSTEEALAELPPSYAKNFMVWAIGGNSPQGMFDSELLRGFEEIYEAFDNDDAGDKYRERLNNELPDVKVKRLEIPEKYNDIDLFLKNDENAIELFKNLIEVAKIQETDGFKIWRDGQRHHWEIKNRFIGIRYEIDYLKPNRTFSGDLLLYNGKMMYEKRVGKDIESINLPPDKNILKIALSNEINNYYHDIRWVDKEPQRTLDELLDIFHLSKFKNEITKQIAWYIFHAPAKRYELLVRQVQKKIKSETDVATILREVNGYENEDVDLLRAPQKIQLAQSFFPEKGDGYMYFAKMVKDEDSPKMVPCLISNRKEEIRLDLLKKKTPQSLLLIQNKYELPLEIETNIRDVENLSLQYEWIHKWVNDEIDEMSYHPSRIIQEIETFIRSIYYSTDEVIKVLSLWIYATYFYTLFSSGFPYLVLNGSKGTGKSTLDAIIHLLGFNPTFVVNITESALFRSIHHFGGTFILDELENLIDSKKVNESGLAAVIKSGYSDKGEVGRVDPDTGFTTYYKVFGPKVISNISGVDDVIADRCIYIETHQAPESVLKRLITPEKFKGERRGECYSITSRAAISALTYFQEVEQIFETNTRVETGNARLTQILRPLVTMARLCGADYEKYLLSFYENNVIEMKKEISLNSLEGKLEYIFLSISEEALGYGKRKWVLNTSHSYDKPIHLSGDIFEIDSVHLKVLSEEIDTTQDYTLKQIHNAMKNVLGKTFDVKKHRIETRMTLNDDGLIRQFGYKKNTNGYRWTLNIRQFISKQTEIIKYGSKQETAEEVLF
jgi:hypothetical protein